MLISCEKCSTTYVLDDKLIPPQGAPVQCTRCQHVFLAKAPDQAGAAPATSTQMFGSPSADANANRTAMFGGGAPAPTNKTVMFGVPGADPLPGSQPPPQAPPPGGASRTMMFGHNDPAPAPGAANRTVMFGAPGSESSPNAPAAPANNPMNRTMMFGVPGADAPAPAAAPAGGAGQANKTAMFGAPGSQTSASSPSLPALNPNANVPTNRTVMFGAPGMESSPDAPAADAPANRTMMFGAPGSGAEPPANQDPRSTMMFGAPASVSPAPQSAPSPKTSNTMMFGAPAAQAPVPAAAAPPKTSNTMMFGTPVAAQPAPAAPGQQKTSSTMIFGATPMTAAASAPSKAKLTEATVRIGPEDLERMMREHEKLARADQDGSAGVTPPEASPAAAQPGLSQKTQMFAMGATPDGATPPAGNESVQARHNKTQMYAMGSSPEAPAPNDLQSKANKTQMFAMSDVQAPAAEPGKHNKTQMFAMNSSAQPEPISQGGGVAGRRTRPSSPLPDAKGALPAPPGVDPSILDTFPPDGHSSRKATPNPPELLNQTLIDDGPGVGGRVELPPEAPPDLMQQPLNADASMAAASSSTQPVEAVEGDPAAALRASVQRRNRIALILIALVLVGAAVGVTWKVFGKMLLNRAPPAAAVEQCEKALSTLRFDDTKSKAAAVVELTEVVTKFPDFVEGHAGLVTALTLQLDDVQQRVRRIEQLVERKNTLVARYNKEHSPQNWEQAAAQLSAQSAELVAEHKPLQELAHDLDSKAREAYKGLEAAVNRVGDPSKQARLAAWRAQALFHAVSGTDQALVLTERYMKGAEGSTPDGWIDLAIPEYAANARVSPELMIQATAKIDELHKRDSTFMRTYVLSARLHLIKKELEAATSDLDQVLTMRKEHDVAAELREWVRKLPKTEEKKE